jgi:hypothetical protein
LKVRTSLRSEYRITAEIVGSQCTCFIPVIAPYINGQASPREMSERQRHQMRHVCKKLPRDEMNSTWDESPLKWNLLTHVEHSPSNVIVHGKGTYRCGGRLRAA